MSTYETLKVFDLSGAPLDVRDSDELACLRPDGTSDEPAILTLKVGIFDTQKDGPSDDCTTREVTLAEYNLHNWLREQGAALGETILIRWKHDGKW